MNLLSSLPAVRAERTGWRDQEISQRHRLYGFNCPAVDLDFLLVEYNLGKPVALIEYKSYQAQMPTFTHPTYRALSTLADGSRLPFCVAFYWPNWAYRVYPVNAFARALFGEPYEDFTELSYVTRLYRLRSLVVAGELMDALNTAPVPQSQEIEQRKELMKI